MIVLLIFAALPKLQPQTLRSEYSPTGHIPQPMLTIDTDPTYELVRLPECGVEAWSPEWLAVQINALDATCYEKTLLAKIAFYESTNNPNADNPTSAATGLLQYMPNTFFGHGCDRFGPLLSVSAQLNCGLHDIRAGYLKQWAVWPKL